MSDELLVNYTDVVLNREENTILRDVNLTVKGGDFIYIIGKVGSGKSTLLKSIYAEIPIEAGNAQVFDYCLQKIKRKNIPYLRRKIGIVFQDFQLLIDRSVEKNLEFVLRATGWKNKRMIQNRIHEVLVQVGMQNKAYKMPHELSGGEQQRQRSEKNFPRFKKQRSRIPYHRSAGKRRRHFGRSRQHRQHVCA
jgi:cell division transport system ATP-binding protein